MDNNNFDPNVMQQLMQMYKEGKIPNMNPNANQNPNMGGMNPNMGGMNPNMGGMNPNMGGMNPNMGGMNNFFWNPNMMNPGFQFVPPPFPNFTNMNQNMDQNQQKSGGENWTLIFERKYDNNKVNVQINSEETVAAAFSKYRIKSLETNVPLKFSLQGKPLDGQLSLNASGLRDNSIITVEKITSDPRRPGCWSLVFERKDENQFISIQIESSKTVKDAINAYRNKMGKMNTNENYILIYNSKTLIEDKTLAESGLKDGAKILVISTGDIIGA
jgi:hypothetical protein